MVDIQLLPLQKMYSLEKEIILLGVLKKRTEQECDRLQELFHHELNWAWIVGQLIRHRLDGYFVNHIFKDQENYLIKQVDQSFRIISDSYREINKVNLEFAQELFENLCKENIISAGLKGLVYNTSIYNLNVRRSNDVDILVAEKDLKKFDEIMRSNGFIQSQDGGKTEASKKAKLIQIMNYHDLVPYCKRVGYSFMKLLRVDVNFQFASKENEITQEVFKYGLQKYTMNGYTILGLIPATHLCHLAVHFYREASNSLWLDKLRDVDLYKIVDIENTIRSYSQEQISQWVDMVQKLKIKKEGYFMLFYLNIFYPNRLYEKIMKCIEPQDVSFIDMVKIEGKDKYVHRKEMFSQRAFNMIYKSIDDENGNKLKIFSF